MRGTLATALEQVKAGRVNIEGFSIQTIDSENHRLFNDATKSNTPNRSTAESHPL
jgi:hypothetical protein